VARKTPLDGGFEALCACGGCSAQPLGQTTRSGADHFVLQYSVLKQSLSFRCLSHWTAMDFQMQELHACSRKALHAVTGTGFDRAPTYSIAPTAEQEPEIPHASLFAGLDEDGVVKSSTGTHSRQTSQNFRDRKREKGHTGGRQHHASIAHTVEHRLPTAAQCAVHLELLEAIFALQHRVLASNALDRTFGLRPDRKRVYSSALRRTVYVRDPRNDAAFAERRKVKWEFFVQAAAARFEAWWGEQCDSVPDWGQGRKHRTGCITHANLPPLGRYLFSYEID